MCCWLRHPHLTIAQTLVIIFSVGVLVLCWLCGGGLVVLGTRLLSGSAHGWCLRNLKEGEEQNELLEAKDDEEKESEVDGEVEERVTQRVHET